MRSRLPQPRKRTRRRPDCTLYATAGSCGRIRGGARSALHVPTRPRTTLPRRDERWGRAAPPHSAATTGQCPRHRRPLCTCREPGSTGAVLLPGPGNRSSPPPCPSPGLGALSLRAGLSAHTPEQHSRKAKPTMEDPRLATLLASHVTAPRLRPRTLPGTDRRTPSPAPGLTASRSPSAAASSLLLPRQARPCPESPSQLAHGHPRGTLPVCSAICRGGAAAVSAPSALREARWEGSLVRPVHPRGTRGFRLAVMRNAAAAGILPLLLSRVLPLGPWCPPL